MNDCHVNNQPMVGWKWYELTCQNCRLGLTLWLVWTNTCLSLHHLWALEVWPTCVFTVWDSSRCKRCNSGTENQWRRCCNSIERHCVAYKGGISSLKIQYTKSSFCTWSWNPRKKERKGQVQTKDLNRSQRTDMHVLLWHLSSWLSISLALNSSSQMTSETLWMSHFKLMESCIFNKQTSLKSFFPLKACWCVKLNKKHNFFKSWILDKT